MSNSHLSQNAHYKHILFKKILQLFFKCPCMFITICGFKINSYTSSLSQVGTLCGFFLYVCMFVEVPFMAQGASHGSTFLGEDLLNWAVDTYSFRICFFKLPVTFPATELFHTGRPNAYRDGQLLLQQNKRLLSDEELVKLHFSMKAMFSQEAAVVLFFFPIDPTTKDPQQGFFSESIIILYNNSSG